MKRINIRVDNCFWKDQQCPETVSFSLPDDVKEVVKTVGNNNYTGTIFKIAENSYSFIMVSPLFNNVFLGSDPYVTLQKEEGRVDLAAYLKNNLIESGEAGYLNRFEISRKQLTADFKKLFLNLDNIYDYDLAVPLPDQKEIDIITKYWQNNLVDDSSALGVLYKKGNQITVSDLISEYRTLFEASYGLTFSSTNSWPGNFNKTYFCAKARDGFLTVGAAEAQMEELAVDCFTQQCEQIKNEFWNEDRANEYTAELEKIQSDAAAALKEAEADETDADAALGAAQTAYEEALDNLKTGSEEAEDQYQDCIAKCAGDPACEAECLAERDATIAKLQAALDEAAKVLADAQAAADAAAAVTAAASEAFNEAQAAVAAQGNLVDQIQALCGEGEAAARSSSAPSIPSDAFNIDESGEVSKWWPAYLKYQDDDRPEASEIRKDLNDGLELDGTGSIMEHYNASEDENERYAVIGNTILNEPQALKAAKIIKEFFSNLA